MVSLRPAVGGIRAFNQLRRRQSLQYALKHLPFLFRSTGGYAAFPAVGTMLAYGFGRTPSVLGAVTQREPGQE
jgi:hypothetical protein